MCQSDLIIYAQCGHVNIKYYMLEGKVVPETRRRCDKHRKSGDFEIPAEHVTLAYPYIKGFEEVVPGPCHKCKTRRRGARKASSGNANDNEDSNGSGEQAKKEDDGTKDEARKKESKGDSERE